MGHGEDFEKQEAGPQLHHLPASRRTSTESTFTQQAIDAEANIEPPAIGPEANGEKGAEPSPPPNGGFKAWLQVAGSFFLFFNAWYVISKSLLIALCR